MSKVRVGIVGTGWGELQIEAFRHVRNAQVVALCDSNAARAQSLGDKHKIRKTTESYQDLISDNSIELVSIATPPELHESMVREAVDAGKHVICEKPIALNACAEGELLKLADSKKVVHAVDYEMRFLPAVAYCKELIDEDYLGSLLRVDVSMVMERPWGIHGNWAAEETRGGGILTELGAHFIDLMRWWFGDIGALMAGRRTNFPTLRIPKAKGEKGNGFENRAITGDDAFWCSLEFERGGEALVSFVTGARHDPGWTISAVGQKGTLLVHSGQLVGMRDGDREMAILPIPKRLELGDNPRDPLMWSMARLMERVVARINGEGEAGAFPDFGDGFATAAVIDAIRRASAERRRVDVERGP